MTTRVIYCKEWDRYRPNVTTELFGGGEFIQDRFLYRGQRDHSWKLTPSFDRIFPDVTNRKTSAKEMLMAFRRSCELQGALPQQIFPEGDLLALGQHYGLPTRLLDWSRSPYVAAFFAFGQLALEVADLSGLADQRRALNDLDDSLEGAEMIAAWSSLPGPHSVAVWALDSDAGPWNEDYGVEIKDASSLVSNIRLRNQGGAFTLLTTNDPDLEQWASSVTWQNRASLWKFVIPACELFVALADMRAMGIDFTRVYPDLQGAANDARVQAVCRRGRGG